MWLELRDDENLGVETACFYSSQVGGHIQTKYQLQRKYNIEARLTSSRQYRGSLGELGVVTVESTHVRLPHKSFTARRH
jgi:hypothetical protein